MSRKTKIRKGDSDARRLSPAMRVHFREMARQADERRTENGVPVTYRDSRGVEKARFVSRDRRNSRGLQAGTCRFSPDVLIYRKALRMKKAARKAARRIFAGGPVAPLETLAARVPSTSRFLQVKRFFSSLIERALGGPTPEVAP